MRRLFLFILFLPTLLFGQVAAPGVGAPNYAGSAATSQFMPSGATSSVDMQTFLASYNVNVLSYGAQPNNMSIDQSAAFNAAIAAVVAKGGGVVFVPGGTYKANLVVSGDNVCIVGVSMPDSTSSANYITPYNVANPTIQVGDDTKRIYNFRMYNVALYGDTSGTAQLGLVINGGLNTAFINNCSFRNFGGHGIKIGPGTNYEIQWIFFDGVIVRLPAAGTPVGVGMYYGTAPSWNTVVFFDHYKIECGGQFGFAVVTDSVKAGFSHGWMQVGDNHGIDFRNNFAGSTPLLYGVCNTVEAGGGQTAAQVYNTSKRKSDFFSGQWHLTQYIKLSDTTTYIPNGDWSTGKFELYQPVIQDAYLADTATPTQTNLHLRVSGNTINLINDSGGTLGITSSNNVDLTNNSLRLLSVGTGISIKEGSNCTMGTATLAAGAATVATTKVTDTSRIFVFSNADGGTPGWLRVSARTAGTSFTITSSSGTDTSTVAWLILTPAP